MATLIVSYPDHDGAHFDADYYRATHIPLVEQLWGPHGMTAAEILFPHGEQPDRAAVLLRFRDQAAVDAALGSPGTPEVMADVAKFTDIAPRIYRSE